MKNRKTVIVAFLLIATLLLGVGYAALSDTLTINATATVSKTAAESVFDEDVKFTAVSAITYPTGVTTGAAAIIDTAADSTSDTGKITIDDGVLKNTGDEVKVTYTISNVGDLAASVAKPTINNTNETYFSVTTDWGDAAKDLAAGEAISVVVTIKLVKTPTADENTTGSFTLTFDATTSDTP